MNDDSRRVFRPVPDLKLARTWFGVLLVVIGVPIIWLLFTLLRTPEIHYVIDSTSLTITSTLGSSHQAKTLSLARLADVRPEWLRDPALRFGTEKPGYCVGFFAYPRLGEVYQITDCSEAGVYLASSGEATPVVVTPADPDRFLKALRAGTPGSFGPPGTRGASWWLTLATVLAVFILVVLALVTVFFVAPARLAYVVRAGQLDLVTLTGKRSVRLAGARAQRHRPLLGNRLSGVPLPGYRIGSWMLDSMATSVAASVAEEGVLVEGEGRLFVTPRDPDAFLAALATAGVEVVTPAPLQRRR